MNKIILTLFVLLLSNLLWLVNIDTVLAQTGPPFTHSDYGLALHYSNMFYEAQRAGDTDDPAYMSRRVEWRVPSLLDDGSDIGYDLTGGWFDAGHHVKFHLPMAYAAGVLGMGMAQFSNGYDICGTTDRGLDNLRWVNDYFLKANPAPGVFVGQVADGSDDHSWWGPPELIGQSGVNYSMPRETKTLPAGCGGDILGATAGSLAQASIVFRNAGDIAYANTLLSAAETYYNEAVTRPSVYNSCISGSSGFYSSVNYEDDWMMGAISIHQAKEAQAAGSGDSYLSEAISHYNNLHVGDWMMDWDNNHYPATLLLAQTTGNATYMNNVESYIDDAISGATGTYTPDNMWFLTQWGSARYPANASFLALSYADYLDSIGNTSPKIAQYRAWAQGQVDYLLGDNSNNYSYMVGFGANGATLPRHSGAHLSSATGSYPSGGPNGWNQADAGANANILYGALVGGPDGSDNHNDSRADHVQNEVATHHNAGLQSALAGICVLSAPIPPTAIPTNTPIPPTTMPTNTPIPPTLTPVPPTNTPISPTPTPIPDGDEHEGDDHCIDATSVETNGNIQLHTFHDVGDVDWVRFEGEFGKVYTVIGNTPLTSTADLVLEIRNSCDDTVEEQGHSFAPGVRLQFMAPATETYYLRVSNDEPSEFGDDVAYSLSVRKRVEDAPKSAVIIVAGRQSSGDILQDNIHHVTNNVYEMYRKAGHPDTRIRYLASDLTLDPAGDKSFPVHGYATADNLQNAITSWAINRVDSERALTIYMMSHGDQDRFFLDSDDEVVTPAQLDGWLEELEQIVQKRGDGELMVNVIIDACHAGSFIDTADIDGNVSASISKGHPNRIVMSSSARYELAWASRQGALFSDYFTFGVQSDFTVFDAFNNASGVTRRASWPQTPWLDDNGNGIPNDPDDGLVAAERGLGIGSSFNFQLWEPYIVESDPVVQNRISVRVRDEKSDIDRVWAVLYPPSYTPPDQNGVRLAVADNQPTVTLFDEGGGVYAADFCPTEAGTWSAIVYAEDGDGLVSRPETITFNISEIGSCTPLTVSVNQYGVTVPSLSAALLFGLAVLFTIWAYRWMKNHHSTFQAFIRLNGAKNHE